MEEWSFFPINKKTKKKFRRQLLFDLFGKFGKKETVLSLKFCLSPIIGLKILLSTLFLLGLAF